MLGGAQAASSNIAAVGATLVVAPVHAGRGHGLGQRVPRQRGDHGGWAYDALPDWSDQAT